MACVVALCAAATLVVTATVKGPAAIARYAEGAPPGFSGGFDEQSCHACHFDADLNSGEGQVTITNVPDRFVAGERYPLTITLTRTGMKLGGFQVTARFKDGGAQAGDLAAAAGEEERMSRAVQGNIQYLSQRHQGTAPVGNHAIRWSVVWTAPKGEGPVVFNVAANAANGDGTAEGDFVHTAAVESSQR
jgi:hypothetical protein